eukprot:754083-Hanusia_phi.AAC.4
MSILDQQTYIVTFYSPWIVPHLSRLIWDQTRLAFSNDVQCKPCTTRNILGFLALHESHVGCGYQLPSSGLRARARLAVSELASEAGLGLVSISEGMRSLRCGQDDESGRGRGRWWG